jgi:hypothetical protein
MQKSYLQLFTCAGKNVVDTEFPQIYKYLFELVNGTVLYFVLEHAVHTFFAINLYNIQCLSHKQQTETPGTTLSQHTLLSVLTQVHSICH